MKYFGTDGIRGIPNQTLTIELCNNLGRALSLLNGNKVIVATDTRISKDMLAFALMSGALEVGLDVSYAGILPTPGLIYNTLINDCIGVMLTASHNPYHYNGIKVVNKGRKLSKNEQEKIEYYLDNYICNSQQIGSYQYNEKCYLDYYNFLKSRVVNTSLKIVIDTANGATCNIAKEVFKDVTKNLIIINNQPDGTNINHKCGSTNIETLKTTVLSNNYDLGFAFDGDGDRLICIDNKGRVIDGDLLVYIFAKYLKQNQQLKNNKVVLTVMSNIGVVKALKAEQIEVVKANVGDQNVLSELELNDLVLGGENSGHIILKDNLNIGDGILNALYLIKILTATNLRIEDWVKDVKMYYDKMLNLKSKDNIVDNPQVVRMIEALKTKFKDEIEIILRKSGTEDLIRLSVMAPTKETVEDVIKSILIIINGG